MAIFKSNSYTVQTIMVYQTGEYSSVITMSVMACIKREICFYLMGRKERNWNPIEAIIITQKEITDFMCWIAIKANENKSRSNKNSTRFHLNRFRFL